MLAAQIATETPASCSFNIPMICSSEKRLRFMLWSCWARANFKLVSLTGKVTQSREVLSKDPVAKIRPSGLSVPAISGLVDISRHRVAWPKQVFYVDRDESSAALLCNGPHMRRAAKPLSFDAVPERNQSEVAGIQCSDHLD